MKKNHLNFGHLLKIFFSVLIMTQCSFAASEVGLQAGDFVTSGPKSEKKIALTFDDGPGPYTKKFLELLNEYQVKGTFFVLGELVRLRPEETNDIVLAGHEIASHTDNHQNYLNRFKELLAKPEYNEREATEVTRRELIDSMEKSKRAILDATHNSPRFCRMPHGIDRPWIKEAAKNSGFILVNWTYGADWNKGSVEDLVPGYIKAIQPGAILLFHDGGASRQKSLEITEAVIKAAQDQGYQLVTLSDLLQDLPIK